MISGEGGGRERIPWSARMSTAERINSRQAFGRYLLDKPSQNPLTQAEIDQIAESARIDDERITGFYAKPIKDKFTSDEIQDLARALGSPTILHDHMPGPEGICIERDNFFCARYR
jgi:hypothetical protein